MIKEIGIFGIPSDLRESVRPRVESVIREFIRIAEQEGLELYAVDDLKETVDRFKASAVEGRLLPKDDLAESVDVVVSFGGDGTILKAAEAVGDSGVPILGVNLGRLGFLAGVSPKNLEEGVRELKAGKFTVDRRMVLSAGIEGEEKRFFALNDVVVEKGSCARILEIEMYINDEMVASYMGNGVVVSSPTGSTAYSLSAGGPIVHPGMEAIIASPICPHSLSLRSMVVPEDEVITVRLKAQKGDDVMLTVDSRTAGDLEPDSRVVVSKAPFSINLMNLSGLSFYSLLREKLGWGIGYTVDRQ